MLYSEQLRTLNSVLSSDLLINSRYDIVSNFNSLNTYAQVNIAGIVQLAYEQDIGTGEGFGTITPTSLKNSTLEWPIKEDVDLYTSGVALGAAAVSAYVPNIQYITDYTDNILDDNYLNRKATSLPDADNTYDLGSSGAKWANIYATNFNGTATRALYADVAEIYSARDEDLEIGELVTIYTGEDNLPIVIDGQDFGVVEIHDIERCREELDIKCFGVVSEKPALLMNAGEDGVPVALVGRVPVKVEGKITKGDPIVSSATPGVGRAAKDPSEYVFAFARALEHKNTDDIRLIECIIKR